MTRVCHRAGVASVEVERVTGSRSSLSSDELSVEEPLEIRLSGHGDGCDHDHCRCDDADSRR